MVNQRLFMVSKPQLFGLFKARVVTPLLPFISTEFTATI
jgi:hypothetical protein